MCIANYMYCKAQTGWPRDIVLTCCNCKRVVISNPTYNGLGQLCMYLKTSLYSLYVPTYVGYIQTLMLVLPFLKKIERIDKFTSISFENFISEKIERIDQFTSISFKKLYFIIFNLIMLSFFYSVFLFKF
jgi:hypothetical protein